VTNPAQEVTFESKVKPSSKKTPRSVIEALNPESDESITPPILIKCGRYLY